MCLSPLFAAIAAVFRQYDEAKTPHVQRRFAFFTEHFPEVHGNDAATGWQPSAHGRFSHCPLYVRRAAAGAGFVVELQRKANWIKEDGLWRGAFIWVLRLGPKGK